MRKQKVRLEVWLSKSDSIRIIYYTIYGNMKYKIECLMEM